MIAQNPHEPKTCNIFLHDHDKKEKSLNTTVCRFTVECDNDTFSHASSRVKFYPVGPKQFFISVATSACVRALLWLYYFPSLAIFSPSQLRTAWIRSNMFFMLLLSGVYAGVLPETTGRHKGEKNWDKDRAQMKSWWNKNRTRPLGETYEWRDKLNGRQVVKNKGWKTRTKANWWKNQTTDYWKRLSWETNEWGHTW